MSTGTGGYLPLLITIVGILAVIAISQFFSDSDSTNEASPHVVFEGADVRLTAELRKPPIPFPQDVDSAARTEMFLALSAPEPPGEISISVGCGPNSEMMVTPFSFKKEAGQTILALQPMSATTEGSAQSDCILPPGEQISLTISIFQSK